MDRTARFRHRTRRHEINEAEARLARRKRAVVSRSARLGDALNEKLTEPGAFIIAGSAGYLIGEFSRPRAGTERSPRSSRPPGTAFDDATFWLKTAVALFTWSKATLATSSADPFRSGEQDNPHRGPPPASARSVAD